MADARKERQFIYFGEDPEGIDPEDIVPRRDKPTGLEAWDDEYDEESQFLRWVNYFGKDYKDLTEMKQRLANWKEFNKDIRDNNTASELSGNPNAPFMDHNKMSDLNLKEKEQMLGQLAATQQKDIADKKKSNPPAGDSDSDSESDSDSDDGSRGVNKWKTSSSWRKGRHLDSDSHDDRRQLQTINDDPITYD